MVERVVLVSPHGFCAGVVRAIATVERALALFPPPVYVRRAIVHNAHVVARLAAAGAEFVDELDDVPRGSVVIFSAHGVPPAVRAEARARDLRVIDATCPLVAKVHREARRFGRLGHDVVLIGHAGHDEVAGTLGQVPGMQLVTHPAEVADIRVADPDRVACVTQTTLSPQEVDTVVDHLRRRFPALAQPAATDICRATRNRQAAVTWLARVVDVVLVVGDRTSSNSQRLREVASGSGTPAHLIQCVEELECRWVETAQSVGVTAGASTPGDVIARVIGHLCREGATLQREMFVDERLSFPLPREVAAGPDAADDAECESYAGAAVAA
ncbi:MAG TPA: 4-hydroxy-3-methylbut-2-enyl diphosphate reductase [Chloroflexota bacterium]|nr:4-hydroxy-3-methylbut-2-enyl diphosphate reductase [Chloroflexota bacterium]